VLTGGGCKKLYRWDKELWIGEQDAAVDDENVNGVRGLQETFWPVLAAHSPLAALCAVHDTSHRGLLHSYSTS